MKRFTALLTGALLLALALPTAAHGQSEATSMQPHVVRWAMEAEAKRSARLAEHAKTRSARLEHGAGFRLQAGAVATWTQHTLTACTSACETNCSDPRAPRGCRAPNCSIAIDLAATIPDLPSIDDGARKAVRYGTPPPRMGCGLWGGASHGFLARAVLIERCLRGEYGSGWDCDPTRQEVLDAEAVHARDSKWMTELLPEPDDDDEDGVPDGTDACPDEPGLFPSGCPSPPSGNPPAGDDPLCVGEQELAAFLDLKCRWEGAPPAWKLFCAVLRPALTDEQEAKLACELRRWFHEMGRTSGQVCR